MFKSTKGLHNKKKLPRSPSFIKKLKQHLDRYIPALTISDRSAASICGLSCNFSFFSFILVSELHFNTTDSFVSFRQVVFWCPKALDYAIGKCWKALFHTWPTNSSFVAAYTFPKIESRRGRLTLYALGTLPCR